ncbi:Hydroxyquinol 1,2-dioxygenase [Sphingobium chlorophenolicum L-1]|uniref:Hydroxyquinol 1,2-dioxygenase n=1 Tax=Sphingobium chlorophenolicum L-1 TaxID=690566 RepID=F6EZ83_SPHCR|nr:intradiol ring-cleavage dioxygenase [Sphingobium chlorophenolicum]AEG50176.1 Hydroxyquinol 1,2-dioxygenase [Sphingobium chlorophenolicum L-1]
MSKSTEPGHNLAFFDAERSADVVNARMGPDISPRFREIMTIIVSHLHAAVKEAALTTEEWMAGIEFLTKTGQMCSDWRQEFILLSDVLGVSMLVDALNHHRPEGSTENTVLGPFYVAGAPHYELGANICLDGKGEPLVVRGRVTDTDGNPVPGAVVDVWATNDDGFYDVQQKGIQPDHNLRGVFIADSNGEYWFRTVKPRFYPIPDDGTVGKLLASLGRHPNRAAHLHFIVKAPGYDTVVTHIFTPDCQYLGEDAVFGVKDSLIADFRQVDEPVEAGELGFSTPFWKVDWNFVLARSEDVRMNEPGGFMPGKPSSNGGE